MENNYEWRKIDKMPSNDKPLLILDSKNKLHILYKEWEERDSFEKWFKLCSEEDIKKWCYFEIDGMNYFDGVLKQNASLQSELDKTIHQLKDYEKALKEYAHRSYYSNFYDGFESGGFTCEYNGKDYENNELAEETLKKWEE